MELDEFGEEIVNHLTHQHAVAEIACDVFLRPVERDGVDPAVQMRQRGGVELGHGCGQREGRGQRAEGGGRRRWLQTAGGVWSERSGVCRELKCVAKSERGANNERLLSIGWRCGRCRCPFANQQGQTADRALGRRTMHRTLIIWMGCHGSALSLCVVSVLLFAPTFGTDDGRRRMLEESAADRYDRADQRSAATAATAERQGTTQSPVRVADQRADYHRLVVGIEWRSGWMTR